MSEFDKIIGYEDIKAELSRFASVLKEPERYSKLGVTTPSGILLYGDPGLGKTLMAKCFIAETGCKVYTLRKEKPNGDFVNQIKETFETAKKESDGITIVFLDDMDKFANEDNMHRDAEEYVAVQSCIDDCKGHGVFTLATVNDRYCLPDSLLRAGRFDKVIEVEIPKGKDAEKIIDHFLASKQIMGDIDIKEISRIMEGKSCAELETVINEAGIYAGFAGKSKIDQTDVVKACMRMMFDSPECINPSDDANTKNIAIHEAGHAVVAEVLDPGSVTLVSVCRHSGSVEGMTKTRRPDGHSISKELQEHIVIGGLGGKAATEMLFGVADMGCNADMHKVFDMVAEFVDDNCTLGFDAFEGHNSSQHLLEKKDRLIASEVERYYQIAKKIIVENRDFLNAVVDALLDHKTVTYREMQTIRESLGRAA